MSDKFPLKKTCPNCKVETIIFLEREDLDRWIGGQHVQNVWPNFTPMQRETIMTGFCSDRCWHEYLGPEE
jgi:hypothetical protein